MNSDKQAVHDFWDAASCGEAMYLRASDYAAQAKKRYALEPCIEPFVDFDASSGRDVSELGVGLGADHQRYAEAGARLTGVDLTECGQAHAFAACGLKPALAAAGLRCRESPLRRCLLLHRLFVGGAAPFAQYVESDQRGLASAAGGGSARIMIYHKYSIVGCMLWGRYGLLAGRPGRSLAEMCAQHLENPGTKAYTVEEARRLFAEFASVQIETVLTHGDLLASDVGQRHRGPRLAIARALWPRWLIRKLLSRHGLFMLIKATK